MTLIRFTVTGTPATAGSKQAFPFKRHDGSLGVRVVDDNPRAKSWRSQVIDAARAAYSGPLLTGAIRLTLTFVRPRPQGHFRTGKNAGQVKDGAPKWPTTKPDCTKLTRAIEDALKSVVWRDDAQVVQQVIAKAWGEPARCLVGIEELSVIDLPQSESELFATAN